MTDGGQNWRNVDRAESTQFAQAGSTIYVATRKGVLASRDDGASWQLSLPSRAGATTVNTAGGETYAGFADGSVYLLTENTWSRAGRAGSGAIHDIAVDPSNTNIAYATVDDAKAANEDLYASLNSGATWSRVYCKQCSIGEQAIAFSLAVPGRLYLGADLTGLFYLVADGKQRPIIQSGAAALKLMSGIFFLYHRKHRLRMHVTSSPIKVYSLRRIVAGELSQPLVIISPIFYLTLLLYRRTEAIS